MAQSAGLSLATWRVLAAAADPGATASRMARRLGLARQSVQRVSDRLVDSGLARYEANPNHRRSPLVQLTDKGTAALKTLDRDLASWESDLGEDFELEELETTLQVLRSLREALRE